MLGHYILKEFQDYKINSLGLRENDDFHVDLKSEIPDLGDREYTTVIHAAGTENNTRAMALNYEGSKHLLKALELHPPRNFVYISSHKVYSREAEEISEDTQTWASDEAGRSKALAEEEIKKWCAGREVTLTILRPARMFGNGVSGSTLDLFNDALSGKYIHIRGNEAKVSIVCALDVAKAVKAVHTQGGIFNVADPVPVRFIDLVESMTANAGAKKRMTHLPANWAEWIWRLGRWIPSIDRNLAPEVVEERMRSRVIDGSRLSEETGIRYHDTVAVIERRDPSYPYEI